MVVVGEAVNVGKVRLARIFEGVVVLAPGLGNDKDWLPIEEAVGLPVGKGTGITTTVVPEVMVFQLVKTSTVDVTDTVLWLGGRVESVRPTEGGVTAVLEVGGVADEFIVRTEDTLLAGVGFSVEDTLDVVGEITIGLVELKALDSALPEVVEILGLMGEVGSELLTVALTPREVLLQTDAVKVGSRLSEVESELLTVAVAPREVLL